MVTNSPFLISRSSPFNTRISACPLLKFFIKFFALMIVSIYLLRIASSVFCLVIKRTGMYPAISVAIISTTTRIAVSVAVATSIPSANGKLIGFASM